MIIGIVSGIMGGLVVVAGLWSMARWEERKARRERSEKHIGMGA